jgi:hypothetical protein
MSTGWTVGVPVLTVTIEIRSSDTDVCLFNSKRLAKEQKESSKEIITWDTRDWMSR